MFGQCLSGKQRCFYFYCSFIHPPRCVDIGYRRHFSLHFDDEFVCAFQMQTLQMHANLRKDYVLVLFDPLICVILQKVYCYCENIYIWEILMKCPFSCA